MMRVQSPVSTDLNHFLKDVSIFNYFQKSECSLSVLTLHIYRYIFYPADRKTRDVTFSALSSFIVATVILVSFYVFRKKYTDCEHLRHED